MSVFFPFLLFNELSLKILREYQNCTIEYLTTRTYLYHSGRKPGVAQKQNQVWSGPFAPSTDFDLWIFITCIAQQSATTETKSNKYNTSASSICTVHTDKSIISLVLISIICPYTIRHLIFQDLNDGTILSDDTSIPFKDNTPTPLFRRRNASLKYIVNS